MRYLQPIPKLYPMRKKYLVLPAFCLVSLSVKAQFVTSGGNTTTNDNVGIGTSAPAFKLEVAGTTPATRTIGINSMPVAYLSDKPGSIAFGNGLRFLSGAGGSGNTAVGVDAGLSLTTGYNNTVTGYKALWMATSAQSNAAFGTYALMNTTEGSFNAAFGGASLQNNTTGARNTGIGSGTLFYNTEGADNMAGGHQALMNNTMGSSNVALGAYALSGNTTGNSNMALGVSANVVSGNLSNATAIGASAVVGKSNALVLGDTTKPTRVGIGTAYPDYMLDVRASANPVRLRGLQAGSPGDYLVTADANGVLRRIPASSVSGGSVNAGQGLTFDGSTMMLGDYCGNGGGLFDEPREINMNNFDLYFNSSEIGKIYMGPAGCQSLTTRLEISASGLNAVNGFGGNLPSPSGLRFTNLTGNEPPIENMYGGVLSLDEDGDVIWVQSCCYAAKDATQYEELQAKFEKLKTEVEMLKSIMRQNAAAPAGQRDLLFQNAPNPAGNSSRIDYALASASSDAFIVVYDMNGRVMNRISLQPRAGKGSVEVHLESWAAGSYSYALFVNGQIRDTKKMQVTH